MLAYLYLAFAILFRFVPHGPFTTFCASCGLWNFTPVGASLLYFGARQPRRRLWIALAALAASDVALNLLVYHVRLDASSFIGWLWYAGALLVGTGLRGRTTVARVLAGSLGVSAVFFVVSNFAVWAGSELYPHTLAGLYTCYALAIPFLRSTVASDLIFSAAFFSLPLAAGALNRNLAQRFSA
ncbi:MAG TPA: DUF6580 family putative transport protein [Terriglobales bacterium]|nr:DUF6580 family putative transport protein [Terriglobales bacterium]